MSKTIEKSEKDLGTADDKVSTAASKTKVANESVSFPGLFGPQLPEQAVMAGIATIGKISANPKGLHHKPFESGFLGARFNDGGAEISIVCGKAPLRSLTLKHFCAVLEAAPSVDPTILLKGHSPADPWKNNPGRGQLACRLLLPSGCFRFATGPAGKPIETTTDVVKFDHYFIRRETLLAFYLFAKSMLLNGEDFEEMATRYSGWLQWEIPEGLCG
jgi:hypothetical protein